MTKLLFIFLLSFMSLITSKDSSFKDQQLANDRVFQAYKDKAEHFSKDSEACIAEIQRLGDEIKLNLGLDWVWLEPDASRYTMDLYDEALNLGQTYYSKKYV